MNTKKLIHAHAHIAPSLDYPKGIHLGSVVRVAPKTIWIKDQFGVEQWRFRPGKPGLPGSSAGWVRIGLPGIRKQLVFTMEPLVAFLLKSRSD
jgi:hypothetical protein